MAFFRTLGNMPCEKELLTIWASVSVNAKLQFATFIGLILVSSWEVSWVKLALKADKIGYQDDVNKTQKIWSAC